MSGNKHQLLITIGAALSGSFSSVISGSTSKIGRLGGAIKDIEKQSATSGAAIDKLKTRYDSLLKSVDKQQGIVEKRGFYKSQILGIVAMGAALAAPIKSAMEFEDSLAGIKAVVDFKAPEDLQKLGDVFSDMSRTMPATADELANIAAVGGRFGIAADGLEEFTKEVAKTAIAWRAPVTETAEHVGNLMKVFHASTKQLPEYFNVINHLGNKTGATADNILKAINVSAAGLANFKLSIPQAAALNSTIMSFGESAEQAGSAVNTMLQKLSIAPQLGATAQKALRGLGLSSVTLPEIIAKDPQKALNKLFAGLEKLDPKKRGTVLYSIFGRGAAKTVGTLVENIALYRKNLALVANQKLYEGSRDGDYRIVLDTAKSQLKILMNTISSFARAVGFALLPALNSIVSGINNVLSPVMKWMEKNKELTKTIVTIVGGFVGFRVAVFALGYASTFLFGGLNRLTIGFKSVRIALSLFGSLLKKMFPKLLTVASAAFGTLCVVSIKLARQLKGTLYKNLEKLSIRIVTLKKLLAKQLKPIITSISKAMDPIIKKVVKMLPPGTVKWLQEVGTFLTSIWIAVTRVIGPLINGIVRLGQEIRSAIPSWAEFKQIVLENWEACVKITAQFGLVAGGLFLVYKILKGTTYLGFWTLKNALKLTMGTMKVFGRVLSTVLIHGIPLAFQGVKLLFSTFWLFASEVIPTTVQGVIWVGKSFRTLANTIIPPVINGMRNLCAAIWRLAAGAISPVIPYMTRLGSALKALYLTCSNKLLKVFPWLGVAVKAFLITSGILIFAGLAYLIYKNWASVKEFFSGFWESVKKKWAVFMEWLQPFFDVLGNIGNLFKNFIQLTYQMGVGIGKILENVVALISKFLFGKDVVIPAWESVKKFFEGMWNGAAKKWEAFSTSMGKADVVKKIKEIWSKLGDFFMKLWDDVSPHFDEWLKPVTELWNKGKSWASGVIDGVFGGAEPSLQLPDTKQLSTASGARNQNNNFEITINANKGDNAESIAGKVMDKISNYSETFLFDMASEAI